MMRKITLFNLLLALLVGATGGVSAQASRASGEGGATTLQNDKDKKGPRKPKPKPGPTDEGDGD